jgi:poly(3-hydroxybutyrate) depolymerase
VSGTGGAGTGGTGAGGGFSRGCNTPPTIPSSQYNSGSPISITTGGQTRRYILNVPTNYDNTKAYKLVIALHPLDGNDVQMFRWGYYGLLSLSNDTTIFVAPNGQKNGAPCAGTGTGEPGCGWANTSGSDLPLIDGVVAQIEQSFCVDTSQIFATGWNYGASMAYELGCQRPLGATGTNWGVRGVAIYSGRQMSGSCHPGSYPVAYYASHGTHDSVLTYDSGVSLAQNWSTANGCTWQNPTSVTTGAHVCTKMVGCRAGYPVEFCSFNGDHTPFPDTGSQSSSWGPPEAWTFLNQF